MMDSVLNAVANTGIASAGYAENWKDFGTNLVANGVANGIGLGFEKVPFTRGVMATNLGRKFIKQGLNSLADKAKNLFYNNKNQ